MFEEELKSMRKTLVAEKITIKDFKRGIRRLQKANTEFMKEYKNGFLIIRKSALISIKKNAKTNKRNNKKSPRENNQN